MRILLAMIGLTALTGCERDNPNYCPPTEERCIDAGITASCTSSSECTAEVCDTESGRCVECTPREAGACTATTPVCGNDRSCRGCETHAECLDSNACGPDGACINAAQVAYVQRGAIGTTCTKAAPCGSLRDALAVLPHRPVVKFATGTIEDNQTPSIDGRAVTLLADPGAKLDRSNNGVLLEVRNDGADVRIYDLELSGGTGTSEPAISIPAGGAPRLLLSRVKVVGNQGVGISTIGGSLTVHQSTISGNTGAGVSSSSGTLVVQQSTISGNTGGGIVITSGQFDITNTYIVGNGNASGSSGGVLLGQTNSGTRRFEFNTVTNNVVAPGGSGGVVCALVTTAFTMQNNIVYNNQIGDGRSQVGGLNCDWTYSNIGPEGVAGDGNLNAAPLFISAGTGNFHLQATSPMRDVAAPSATLAVDFDDQPRPQGAGRDIGADEIP